MRRRPPFAPWLVAAALVFPLGACGLFGGDDAPAGTTTTPATTSTTTPAATLLSSGAEPRRALRLRLTEGATTTATLRLDLDVSQQSNGRTQALDNPAVVETVRFTVDRVRADEADLSFTFTAAQVDRTGSDLTDAEYLTLTAEVDGLVGIGGTGTVSSRGGSAAFSYDLPEDLAPAVAATLDQAQDQFASLAVPLPAEPVGVGARWRTDTTAVLAGLRVRTVTTYEVTAIEGDVVSYAASSQQTAPPQDVDLATLPAGTTARLLSSTVTGTATGTLALADPIAASTSRSKGTQVIEVTRGSAAAVRTTQQLELAVDVKLAG